MELFNNASVNIGVLKQRAFNYRWAEVAEGVIPLTAADPDFPVAPEIVAAIKEYIEAGYFSYTPKLGLPAFRESIAAGLVKYKNEPVDARLVLPIDSAARGMYIITETVLSPGDEVVIFDPVDYLFRESVLAAGGVPVLFPTVVRDGLIDLSELERYVTPKTKMIGLCNPHNPLGMTYTEEQLDFLLQIAEKHDLWIMNDEIWSDIIFPERKFVSILSLGAQRNKKTLSVYGFSKAFGVAGLRIGCVYVQDEDIFERIVEKSQVMTTAGGISSLSQIAGIACLDKARYWTEAFLEHLVQNRDYAYKRLNDMPGIRCHLPVATYLIFPDITGTGLSSSDFAAFMMENVKLGVVAGVEKFFGPGAEGHVRICFATSREILKEGLDRFERGVELIGKRK